MQLIGCRDQSQLFLLEGQNEERGRCQESKAPQLLNDDIKIQTANVKKLESKRGDPNISNCVREKKMEKIIPAKKLDKQAKDERQNVTKQKGKILSDEKQTKRQSDGPAQNFSSRSSRDDLRLYENWSPRQNLSASKYLKAVILIDMHESPIA